MPLLNMYDYQLALEWEEEGIYFQFKQVYFLTYFIIQITNHRNFSSIQMIYTLFFQKQKTLYFQKQ